MLIRERGYNTIASMLNEITIMIEGHILTCVNENDLCIMHLYLLLIYLVQVSEIEVCQEVVLEADEALLRWLIEEEQVTEEIGTMAMKPHSKDRER